MTPKAAGRAKAKAKSGVPVCCPERAANWMAKAFQIIDELKKAYDEVQLDVELPAFINAIDWEAVCQWHDLRPVPDGPRVLTMAKLLQDGSGREYPVYLAAFQMFAFNIAFEHPEFKQMLAALQQSET